MPMIAFLTGQLTIRSVFDHLVLKLPREKPTPLGEFTLVPVDEEGRELPVG